MSERTRLLANVTRRNEVFVETREEDAVASAEALSDVTALTSSFSPSDDAEVADAAGKLFWFRFLVLDRGVDRKELDRCLPLLAQAYRWEPTALPDEVREVMGARAVEMLEETSRISDAERRDRAIDLLAAALDGMPDAFPMIDSYWFNLALAYRARLSATSDPGDRNRLIDALRQSVAKTHPRNPELADWMSKLAVELEIRFETIIGRPDSDLDEAVELFRKAVDITAEGDPALVGLLSNLGNALGMRFVRVGLTSDVDEGIVHIRRAVALSRGPAERAKCLANLSQALVTRHEALGAAGDLDEAIDAARTAIETTPSGDYALGDRCSRLGTALRRRFERDGASDDCDGAVELGRRALDLTRIGDPRAPKYQSNLAGALQSRYDQLKALEDLDEAIEHIEKAVEGTPASHPKHGAMLSNLGVALQARFEQTAVMGDLDRAVAAMRNSVEIAATGSPDRARFASNLGAALRARFDACGNPEDLVGAIAALTESVATGDSGHPDRSTYLVNLGAALQLQGLDGSELEARAAFREAATIGAATPRVRGMAGWRWAKSAAAGGAWAEAIDGYAIAVEMLARIAPRGLVRVDQEQRLTEMAGIGSEATACCLQAGETARAIELWEQGRGVLLAQALDARSDVTALAERDPRLAERFCAVRDQLEVHAASAVVDAAAASPQLDSERRRRLASEFDAVVAEIRGLPDFGGFLLPPPIAELMPAARDGPVVLINVSELRSDALLLTAEGTDVLPLAVTPGVVHEHVIAFLTARELAQDPKAGPAVRARGEQEMTTVLEWLWDTIAGPVLEHLGNSTDPAREKLPRVWWCPSGVLSFLPLHAAGRLDDGAGTSATTVMDRAVSSYTPTLRALLYARRRPAERDGMAGRVLVVAMPKTPGGNDLPAAVGEAELLARLFRAQARILNEQEATVPAVLAELSSYPWTHFACHASSDIADPSKSYLLIHGEQDGSRDQHSRGLTVLEIATLRLDAELAFLSACATARPGVALPDEAIHLASAFQLAGYRHVIATLWPVYDVAAAQVADRVYNTLAPAETAEGSARALHTAGRSLRDRYLDRPSAWGAHVHYGS
jgi:tetratricopeptide (TPR) repeat protein